jgi:hypothetical protein
MHHAVRLFVCLALVCLGMGAGTGVRGQGRAGTGSIPEPKDVFGFQPGADYKLASHEQIVDYFHKLDAASDRIIVEDIGKSTEGRPMILALISSEANLKNRERYKAISRQLALARGTDEPTARKLAKEGKAIIWIDGGLHATEVAHAQHTPELGWWLVTSGDDEARRIRENAILLLMPDMNPDGLDLVRDWYYKNIGTPFETTQPPAIYHHYVGHDNNRDWYMFTQVETQAVARQLYHEWFPQIVYNHHQSSPFPGRIWGPPMKDPVNPNLDPLIVSTVNQLGEAMRKRFDEEGKPGYVSHILYDMWWNGSMRGAPDFHNMAGFLTETALYRYASPKCYTAAEVPDTFGERHKNLPAKIPSTNYTNPWLGGCWPLRQPVEYMLTASRATLDLGASQKEHFLFNIWRMGTTQIARGEKAQGGPFAYVIELAAQHDQTRTVEFLRTFRQAGIEVRRADAPFTAGGHSYPAGSYVLGPQAFRPYVVDLMEPKTFPERRLYPGGPPDPPYDTTGYELRFQMGVKADAVKAPFTLPSTIVDVIPAAPGGVQGTGTAAFAIAPAQNLGVMLATRMLKAGARLGSLPSGELIVENIARDAIDKEARTLGVTVRVLSAGPASLRAMHAPRIGLYKSFAANMDEGWTRWLLEQYGFTYTTLSNADVRSGDLSAKFDVLLFSDEDAERIVKGHAPGSMPPAYVGGIGEEGVANVKRFVEGGGWLVAWDGAADFAISTLGLPLRNMVKGTKPSEFFIPGSLIRLVTKPELPLAAGMERDAVAMFSDSQAFETTQPAAAGAAAGANGSSSISPRDVEVFAEYAAKDFLLSGWELGGTRYLAGHIAAARVPVGKGQAVVFGFRPHWRGQPHNTFKLLFNAILQSAVNR